VHLRLELQTDRRPFEQSDDLFNSNRLRRSRQHVSSRRTSDRVNQVTAPEQNHDLTKILQRDLLVTGDFLHLHGTPELIVLRQFCEREQSVMTLRTDLHLTRLLGIG